MRFYATDVSSVRLHFACIPSTVDAAMRLLYLPFDVMLTFCFQLAAAVFFLCDVLQRKWKYRLVINIILLLLCNAPDMGILQGCKLVSVIGQ